MACAAIYGPERRFHYRLGRPLGDGALLVLGGRNALALDDVENTASLLAEAGRHPAAPGEVLDAVDPGELNQFGYVRRWRAAPDGPRVVIPFPLVRLPMARGPFSEPDAAGRIARTPAFLDPYVMEPSMRRFRWAPSRAWSCSAGGAGGARGGAQPDVRLISTGSGSGSGSGRGVLGLLVPGDAFSSVVVASRASNRRRGSGRPAGFAQKLADEVREVQEASGSRGRRPAGA